MTFTWVHAQVLLGGLAGRVAADPGSDFSNNLFTDIAPLLALFGERFAQQFLSEAYTWLDCIIFAMAPLGIISAIVGAIRVGGYPWMRSVIGRARENRASAEIELMSSTSHEVCELWNGQAIVRTLGRPLVKQIIVLESEVDDPKTFGIYTLEAAHDLLEEKPYKSSWTNFFKRLKNGVWDIWKHFKKGKSNDEPAVLQEEGRLQQHNSTAAEDFTSGIHVVPDHHYSLQAPNILLNLHHGSNTIALVSAAILGTFLQISVLVFAGLAAKYDTFRARIPAPESQRSYGFPLLATGTILLTCGLIIVASVIDQSTTERSFKVKGKKAGRSEKIHTFWLQREHVVGDQAFNSFVIRADKPHTEVLTSRRQAPKEDTTKQMNERETRTWSHSTMNKAGPEVPLLTLLGTTIGLSGFILQFQGFRSVHWLSAIVQLGATGTMTAVRALTRGHFMVTPKTDRAIKDHEIDLMACKMASKGMALKGKDCGGLGVHPTITHTSKPKGIYARPTVTDTSSEISKGEDNKDSGYTSDGRILFPKSDNLDRFYEHWGWAMSFVHPAYTKLEEAPKCTTPEQLIGQRVVDIKTQ